MLHPATMIHALRTQSPIYLTARMLSCLGLESRWQRRAQFLHGNAVRNPGRAPKILLAALRNAGVSHRQLLDRLRDSVVAEIGCGPHAGLSAFAAACGASRYIGIDPSLDASLFAAPETQRLYLAPAQNAAVELVRTLGLEVGADERLESGVAEILELRRGGAEFELKPKDRLDVSFSVSCLEHIQDFPAAARALAASCKPDALHAHIINFSNHISKASPFAPLYDHPFERFTSRWGHIINGLRAPDIVDACTEAGLALALIPLDLRPEALPVEIDPSWTARYDRRTLAIRSALLTNLPAADGADQTR